jgi:hypothetical protein
MSQTSSLATESLVNANNNLSLIANASCKRRRKYDSLIKSLLLTDIARTVGGEPYDDWQAAVVVASRVSSAEGAAIRTYHLWSQPPNGGRSQRSLNQASQ